MAAHVARSARLRLIEFPDELEFALRLDQQPPALTGHRAWFVLLGVVAGRPLIAVVADDESSDATVLISVYEPDQDHGWTPGAIRANLEGDRREEGP